MLAPGFSYESCVALSERVCWKITDVIPPGQRLDFSKKFLPDSMVDAETHRFLSAEEQLTLNQIRGNSYAYLFQFVEEYIIALTTKHASAEVFGDLDALRALLRFSEEEVKHQKVFRMFNQLFEEGIKGAPGLIGSSVAVAEAILGNSPMGVLLITLHIELMTQRHWVEIVSRRDPEEFDPLFRNLLKHHWLEEAQHAKIDTLELEKLAADASKDQIEKAIDEYIGILKALSGLLAQQASHDVETLVQVTGRSLSADERRELLSSQERSYRHVFIRLGISAPGFMDVVGALSTAGSERVTAYVATLD